MFNIKISALSAAAGFLLSFLVGLMSGGTFLIILMRALFFALVFFLLAGGIYVLIGKFLPELFPEAAAEQGREDASGSLVDISLGDSPNEAAVEIFGGPEKVIFPEGREGSETAGRDISENPLGLDQNREDGYTDKKEAETNAGDYSPEGFAGESFSGEPAALPTVSGPVDMLPELDSMAGVFVSSGDTEAEGSNDYNSAERPPRQPGKSPLGGDFNPKDLAAALQTIIKRE
ncbi:MAG: hypothetical protein LBP42_06810 [Treponema sp.]|nr:hypothetical protein [Treponema sp.]